MSNGFVVLMGVGTVFIGLVCLIIICKITSGICRLIFREKPVPAAAAAAPAASEIPNRQEFVAAVSAAIAEDLGTDISGIRTVKHSFIFQKEGNHDHEKVSCKRERNGL